MYRLRNGGDDGNNDADDEFRNDIGRLIDEGIYYRGLSLRRIVREEYDSGQEGEKQSARPSTMIPGTMLFLNSPARESTPKARM